MDDDAALDSHLQRLPLLQELPAVQRAVTGTMLRGGGGSIVVTSSVQSIATRKGTSAYSASKRALVGLVQATALEYDTLDIRVNALCPGSVAPPCPGMTTPM
ncbi:SDR family oxidoreductase [Myxococcus xanthus]|uniref:SDR family oxidoreductase n=1 Tax=Myxococcus xanthus TaxID=34 RepID=UPI00214F9AB0|nr:SDR family oxidoreductase [Myxococcus xanthus]